ncbi:MAG: hypothetical protein HQL99_08370 [Magnetococcales bacterium]|nr:hypothetical protein [Magnetococcales bacterium]
MPSFFFPARFAIAALLAFLGIIGWQNAWPQAVLVHLLLAVGGLPLILAVMIYFTPVLTRSGPIPGWIHALPLLAMVAGGLGVWTLAREWWLLGLAAPLAMLTAAVTLGWMSRRASRSLGSAHPCLLWYQTALVCLMLGLLAILATLVWPEQWSPLRSAHRHLNLLGWIGLTAVGTLQVLLPTVGGYTDPLAGQRLFLDRKYAVLGVVLMTGGAAWEPWLSVPGVVAWGWVLARLLPPMHGHGIRMARANGSAISLLGALFGFWCALVSALWQQGQVMLPLFLTLFLFPLVTGALAHLLPLWWWPGLATPQRNRAQHLLGRWALLRVGTFWLAGAGLVAGAAWGAYLAAAPLLLFLGQVAWLARHTRTEQA